MEELAAPVTKKQPKKQQAAPTASNTSAKTVDLKKKKKKTKVIEITISTSESDQEQEEEEEEEVVTATAESESGSESEEKPKPKSKKIKSPVKSTKTKSDNKVSSVSEPKKSKKPDATATVTKTTSATNNKRKKDVVQKKAEKKSKKKSRAKSSESSTNGEEDDDDAETPKKKAILKRDQDIEVPEMTRLIAAYASGGDEEKIQMIYDTQPKIYQRLVELVKPYRKVWCYSSSPARIILRLNGANFVMLDKLDNICSISSSYKKKEDFPLESLYREYVDDTTPIDKDTKDSRLFELLATEKSLTDPVDSSTKMQQCIIHDPDLEKSYWVNSPEGRENLGPVINTNIKKFDDKTIAAEIANIVSIRNEIIKLFVNTKNSSPSTTNNSNSNKKKRSADEVIEEKDVKKKKITATTTPTTSSKSSSSSSSSSSSKKKETPPSPVKETSDKKKKTSTKDDKPKSTKKVESVTVKPTSNNTIVVDDVLKTSGGGVKIRKSVVKPTNVAVKTMVVDVDEETKNRIMKMSPTEIFTMLQNEKKKIDDDNKVEFENVEWYDRFDLLMGTNSKSAVNRSTPVIQTH